MSLRLRPRPPAALGWRYNRCLCLKECLVPVTLTRSDLVPVTLTRSDLVPVGARRYLAYDDFDSDDEEDDLDEKADPLCAPAPHLLVHPSRPCVHIGGPRRVALLAVTPLLCCCHKERSGRLRSCGTVRAHGVCRRPRWLQHPLRATRRERCAALRRSRHRDASTAWAVR